MRLYDYKQIRLWWTLSNDDNEFFTCMQKILDNDELMAVCFFIDCVNIRNDSYPCYIDKFNKRVNGNFSKSNAKKTTIYKVALQCLLENNFAVLAKKLYSEKNNNEEIREILEFYIAIKHKESYRHLLFNDMLDIQLL